ncbi:MAG: PAS domain S-box protein [Gammaproteobacteria bacterium]|nr:PAS domain S-box protein [Gammaproteobacteria bacterium]
MKIKTALKLVIVLSLLVSASIGSWVYSLYQAYAEMKDDAYITQKLSNVIQRINSTSSEYLLYYQERASIQWKSAHLELGEVLTDPEINHAAQFVELDKVIDSHERLQTLFEQLEKINGGDDTAIVMRQRKALASQLLTSLQVMSQVTSELVSDVELKRKDIERKLSWLSFVIFIAFVVILIFSWILIAYRIVIPVNNLKNYIVNIDANNLAERYEVKRNDEVGELVTSFNRMAENLLNTTVSKQKLTNEIEERKRSEEELIKQTNLNKSVLENTGNVVVVLDRDGNFIKFNHAAEQVTGYSRYELLYKPVWDFVIPEEQQPGVKKVFENLKDGNIDIAGNYENHWVTKNGDYRLFDWHNDVIKNAENEVKYIVAIGHDITDKRKDEAEKQRMQRELEQSHKMDALGQLTGGIAHDFNNMLGVILGYAELAVNKAKDNNDLSIQNYLEQVITASNRAKELIAKMLTFSRADKSASQVVSIELLLDESIDLMKSILPSTIKLEKKMQKNLPMIAINPTQFQQVIMNLMINAKDAMDGVGILNISTALYYSRGNECSSCHQKIEGEWVEVIIKDNGSGMTDEVKERIFDPFFTTKNIGEGTGMGLSVIHGIVKGHGGHIIVKSTEGVGTSFHLLLPFITSGEKHIADNTNFETESIKGSAQRILIIDDETSLVDFQYELLNANGYICTKMYDSSEALELYLSSPGSFDLILTDQTMPGVTGLEIIDLIRSKGLTTPVIIETGYSDKIKEKYLDTNNVTLLKKPVKSKELLYQIAKILTQ